MSDWASAHPSRRYLPPEGVGTETAKNQVLMGLFPLLSGSELAAFHVQPIGDHLVIIVVRPWVYTTDIETLIDEIVGACGLVLVSEDPAINDGRNYWT